MKKVWKVKFFPTHLIRYLLKYLKYLKILGLNYYGHYHRPFIVIVIVSPMIIIIVAFVIIVIITIVIIKITIIANIFTW